MLLLLDHPRVINVPHQIKLVSLLSYELFTTFASLIINLLLLLYTPLHISLLDLDCSRPLPLETLSRRRSHLYHLSWLHLRVNRQRRRPPSVHYILAHLLAFLMLSIDIIIL